MASAASPPSKSSLATWWKQFKQRPHLKDDELDYLSDSEGASGSGSASAEGGASGGIYVSGRPKLRHLSHSSSAIGTIRSPSNQSVSVNGSGGGASGYGSASSGIGGGSGYNSAVGTNAMSPETFQADSGASDNAIFGVPLKQSVDYAWVPISLTDPETGESFKYGHIPVIVAKCGRYLKKNATSVEGIFRLSGSARRIKELQVIFSTPTRYGKDLDWTGFNVHDAANVLRRYLNNLPEPIVPLQFYEQFRDPLREYPRVVEYLTQQSAATSAALGAGASGLSSLPSYRREQAQAQAFAQAQAQAQAAAGNQGGDDTSNHGPTIPLSASVPRSITLGLSNEESTSRSRTGSGSSIGAGTTGSIGTGQATASSTTLSASPGQSPFLPARTSSAQQQLQSTQQNGHTSTQPSQASQTTPEIGSILHSDINAAVDRYQHLISILPPLNRQLLMYILDLLSVFAARAEENLMPAANLAAIFQPSILSHPNHDMSPQEYHLSRSAIEFLVQHSNKFLTHVENEAIRQHQQDKRDGKTTDLADPRAASSTAGAPGSTGLEPVNINSATESTPESTTTSGNGSVSRTSGTTTTFVTPNPYSKQTYENGSGGSSGGGLTVHRRRHSKSLSSVGSSGPPVPIVGSNYHSIQRVPVASISQEPNTTTAAAGGAPPPLQYQRQPSDDSNGFLTTIKRTVSITRRPSQRRSTSGSSTSSAARLRSSSGAKPTPGTLGGSVVSTPTAQSPAPQAVNIPEIITTNASQVDITTPSPGFEAVSLQNTPGASPPLEPTRSPDSKKGLSNLFSRKSKSPNRGRASSDDYTRPEPSNFSNQSIDQAMAMLSTTGTTDLGSGSSGVPGGMHHIQSSLPPPQQPFLHHSNHSNSSLGQSSTTSGGGAGDSDYDTGNPRPQDDSGSPNRKTKSRWRRSLMMFNMAGVGDSFHDLSNTSTTSSYGASHVPDLQTGDNLSPTNSAIRSQSPGRWFKKKALNRGRSSSRDGNHPDPDAPSDTAPQ
ncbi:Sac7p [Sugiyamaella lignohabitans]|uniref:Sac7p n=1 Tax=Sugiyamaella lignohabitans TaxID=796027 RepID=A0A167EYE5_9ASCO|nr:Sac7p [Sugiyamaella lignohabitans]ANB14606.1 Sac7p [Sugiyamaella lignohabitans]